MKYGIAPQHYKRTSRRAWGNQ